AGPEAEPAGVVHVEHLPPGQLAEEPVDRHPRAVPVEAGAPGDLLATARRPARGFEAGIPEDAQGQPVDELLVEDRRAEERRVDERPQRRPQARGQGPGRPLHVFRQRLAHHGRHTSKKLNHWVGCRRTMSSRSATHARTASASPRWPTDTGAPTVRAYRRSGPSMQKAGTTGTPAARASRNGPIGNGAGCPKHGTRRSPRLPSPRSPWRAATSPT